MKRLLAIAVCGVFLLAGFPAAAQLVGTDTASGDSCAGFAQGATRMTADADLDGGSVVLICDGTNWQPMSAGGSSATHAFMAHRNGSNFTLSGSDQRVNWTAESYDLANEMNLSSDRFIPTEAGYYYIAFTTAYENCSAASPYVMITKNGTSVTEKGIELTDTDFSQTTSIIVYMNGTTDYIETHVDAAECDYLEGESTQTYFTGFKIDGGGGGGGGGVSFPLAATPVGSASAPAYSFTSDTDTGMYAATAAKLSFATGGTERVRVTSTGMSIGSAADPTAALDVSGDIKFTGVITDASDIRLKKDIAPLGPSLAKITALEPISFRMKSDDRHTEYGFAAQDVKKIYPALVVTADDPMQSLSLNYVGLIAPMTQAIKELNAKVLDLEAENAKLEAERKQIEDKLAALAADIRFLKTGTARLPLKVRADVRKTTPETTAAP